MKAHDLAAALLKGPNVPVCLSDNEIGTYELSARDVFLCNAGEESPGWANDLWYEDEADARKTDVFVRLG